MNANDKQSNAVQKLEKLQVQVPQQGFLKSDSTLKSFSGFTFTFRQASWLAREAFLCNLIEGWQVGAEGIFILQCSRKTAVLQKSSGAVWNNVAIDFFLPLLALLGKGKKRKKNRFFSWT